MPSLLGWLHNIPQQEEETCAATTSDRRCCTRCRRLEAAHRPRPLKPHPPVPQKCIYKAHPSQSIMQTCPTNRPWANHRPSGAPYLAQGRPPVLFLCSPFAPPALPYLADRGVLSPWLCTPSFPPAELNPSLFIRACCHLIVPHARSWLAPPHQAAPLLPLPACPRLPAPACLRRHAPGMPRLAVQLTTSGAATTKRCTRTLDLRRLFFAVRALLFSTSHQPPVPSIVPIAQTTGASRWKRHPTPTCLLPVCPTLPHPAL